MLIFGHPWVQTPLFKKVFSQEDIAKVATEEVVLLEPLSDSIILAQYCRSQKRNFAVTVNSITEALFANALGSCYIICQQEDAIKIQPIAQEYLFDSKILTLINSEKEIQKMAEHAIDGVLFPEAITVA